MPPLGIRLQHHALRHTHHTAIVTVGRRGDQAVGAVRLVTTPLNKATCSNNIHAFNLRIPGRMTSMEYPKGHT